MKKKSHLFCLSLFLFGAFCWGQKSKDSIIVTPITSTITDEQIENALRVEKIRNGMFVVFENKFYTVDFMEKVFNKTEFSVDIIKVPDSIKSDIKTLFLVKRRVP